MGYRHRGIVDAVGNGCGADRGRCHHRATQPHGQPFDGRGNERGVDAVAGRRHGASGFWFGRAGRGLVAAIVSSLALAWGLGEVAGYRRSLEYKPFEARWFYAVYAVCVAGGALAVAFVPNLITLNVGVQVMNALLLPLVLGFLIALSRRALPPQWRLRGLVFCGGAGGERHYLRVRRAGWDWRRVFRLRLCFHAGFPCLHDIVTDGRASSARSSQRRR